MVGKDQVGINSYSGHVATGTLAAFDWSAVPGIRMAARTHGVVGGPIRSERLMRRVAAHTFELFGAILKTSARSQEERLMPRIPWVQEIAGIPDAGLHAVALAAECVHLLTAELGKSTGMGLRRIGSVRRTRAMAILAPDAEFTWGYGAVIAHAQGTGGVASEALQNSRGRIEHAIPQASCIFVARSDRERLRRPVPAFPMLQIIVIIQPAHKGNRLVARAERPVSWLLRGGAAKRPRMSSGGLCGELLRMALTANR